MKKKKVALITGITGQDGSYLAEFLLTKNYEVHGLRRRSSTNNLKNLSHLNIIAQTKNISNKLNLHYGDMIDSSSLNRVLKLVKPDEIYNLAAQSDVHISFQIPEYTSSVNAIGCLNLIDAMTNNSPNAKFYQASTSEMFGNHQKKLSLNEKSLFQPCSPYGSAKVFAYNLVKNYRAKGYFIANGILFNHESPRRGTNFITRKIIEAAVKIKENKQDILYLGNIYAYRDWGYAKDYVESMWKMLQHSKPEDFVVSTGVSTSVKKFAEKVFTKLGYKIIWKGKGINEIAYDLKSSKILIKIDPYYFRAKDIDYLKGNSSKAKKILKWSAKTNLDQLIDIMLKSEMSLHNKIYAK